MTAAFEPLHTQLQSATCTMKYLVCSVARKRTLDKNSDSLHKGEVRFLQGFVRRLLTVQDALVDTQVNPHQILCVSEMSQ